MRSFLFVPADSARKLDKAMSSGADALIVDLEDSIALNGKARAREAAAAFLEGAAADATRPYLMVRVNGLDTGLTDADDETKGFQVGAVDYIHKPFSPSVVKARVHTHLVLREAHRHRRKARRAGRFLSAAHRRPHPRHGRHRLAG